MKKIPNNSVRPLHIPPKLNKESLLFSFENQWKIQKAYKEILGLNGVDHFSINIANTLGEMTVISYSPSVLYNIVQDGSYLYNGSISPSYYEKLDFYTWDQCFDRRFYKFVKDKLQVRNGIEMGMVMVYRSHGYNVLFSFATRCSNSEILDHAQQDNTSFLKMGFHCFDSIKHCYADLLNEPGVSLIEAPNKFKPVCGLPNLRIVK